MTVELAWALAAVAGYLLGSIPFGLVLTKPFGYDLRSIGSGNIGATNVLRTGRKELALLTLILDSGKGAAAAVAALWLAGPVAGPVAGLVAGVAAVLGHNFPVWLRFKGGKGVATTLGVLLVTAWPVGVAACATWLLVAAISRYSSLSALVCLSLAPVYAAFLATESHVIAYAVLAVLAIARHHENIKRLIAGTESKIGQKKK